MKRPVEFIVSALVALGGPQVSQACPLVVQSQACHAVAVQAVPVQVQSFAVQAAPVMVQAAPVQVQSYAVQAAPVAVQAAPVAVQNYGVASSSVLTQAVAPPVVVQNVVRGQRVRPVRSRSISIQRTRTGVGLF